MNHLGKLLFLSVLLTQNSLAAVQSRTSQFPNIIPQALLSVTTTKELIQVCEVKIDIDSGIGGTGNKTRTGGIGGTGHTVTVPDITNIPEIPDVPVDTLPELNIPEINTVPSDAIPGINIPDNIPSGDNGVELSIPGQ